MWPLEHLILLTILAAVAVIALACVGFSLSVRKFPGHPVAAQVVSVSLSMAITIIFSVALNQLWAAKRDMDQRAWTARTQHLQRLQLLLRTEADSLTGIARTLREGRYVAAAANEARTTVWQDDVLTTDVERHFPEYFREREQLISGILDYDREFERLRHVVSGSLQLADATEPYRSDLLPALVNKCGGTGAPGMSFTHDAGRTYEQYRCTPDLSRACQRLFERAADLADAASLASETARRYAEETVLHGSCTYAPAEKSGAE